MKKSNEKGKEIDSSLPQEGVKQNDEGASTAHSGDKSINQQEAITNPTLCSPHMKAGLGMVVLGGTACCITSLIPSAVPFVISQWPLPTMITNIIASTTSLGSGTAPCITGAGCTVVAYEADRFRSERRAVRNINRATEEVNAPSFVEMVRNPSRSSNQHNVPSF